MRPSSPVSQLPVSVAIGLALPAAILGIVLLGMNLHLIGMLAWTAAIAMISVVLRGWYAVAVVMVLALSGVVLWRLMLGGAAILSDAEQMALVLLTVLAGGIGRLLAREMQQRDSVSAAQLQLDVFSTTIESILEASRDCIKLLATDGTILSINEPGVKLIGAESAEQLIGKNWFSLWGAEQQKQLSVAWHEVLTQGHAQFEGSGRMLTGERRIWQNTFTLVRTPAQSQEHVICISCDVTDSVNMQHLLNANVAQLSAILNNIDDVSLAVDNNWNIRFANQCAEQLCVRVGRPNAVGRNLWEIFPLKQGEPISILIRRVMEEQIMQRFEYFFAPQQIWLSITAFPSANGINLLARDISALKQAQKISTEETARLQVAQEIAGFGDWRFDYDQGSMQFSAPAMEILEMENCSPHEYKKHLLEKLNARDRMALVQAIVNCTEAEPTIDLIVNFPARDGTQKHLHWIGRLLADERGNATRMLGAIRDISEDLHVQHALEKAQSLTRNLMDTLPQQIVVVDKSGRVVIANHAWIESRKQHDRSDKAQVNFFELDEKEEGSHAIVVRAQQALRAILDGSEARVDYEYTIDNESRYFLVQTRPLRDDTELLAVFMQQEVTFLKRPAGIDDVLADQNSRNVFNHRGH